jgi:hypothetical protein
MYKMTPRLKNTYAKIVSLVSLILGATLFVVSNMENVLYPAIAQLFGLILLTASIYIASVFLLRQYTFAIDQNPNGDKGELDFTITERKGNRDITVCRIGLDEITSAREVNGKNKKAVESERKKMQRYTYDTSFIPARRIEIICRFDDNDLSILVTFDEQLLKILNNK